MRMSFCRSPRRVFALVALALAASTALVACGPSGTQQQRESAQAELERLAPKQVTEYRGEKLGSITDFRENSIKGPQDVDIATYRLKIAGKVASPTELTYDQVLALPASEKLVTLYCVEGWSVACVWKGVKLTTLLEQAGWDGSGKVLIFRAVDGYSSSLPLSYVEDNDIVLAYQINGLPLPKARGFPFQVVAEDKWGYKWVKWVDSIEVSDDVDFKGYWESRGYENDATLPSER